MGLLSDIKPYFRTHLDVLGFREHTEGFNLGNIPDSLLDKTYHVLVTDVTGGPVSHTHQSTESNVTVSLYFKGYRDSSEAIDVALGSLQDIIIECCKLGNRSGTGAGILNVVFEDAKLNPLSADNDSTAFLEIRFTAQVLIAVEG